MQRMSIAAAALAVSALPLGAGAQGVQAGGWEARLDFEADIDDVLSLLVEWTANDAINDLNERGSSTNLDLGN